MAAHLQSSSRESRHLWVGGLPDGISEVGIKEYFSKFGKIEGVKILPQKYPNIGVAAFIDFYDVKSAVEAQETKHKLGGNELRTNFKAKTTEKFDASKKITSNLPERPSKDQQRGSSSSSSSESDTDDASSSSSTSSDQNTNGKMQEKRCSDVNALFLKVTGLANRPERILQDGLYYEFCRYSPQAVVKMYGEAPERRSAIVKYNCVESCREAFTRSQGMVLFGSKLKLVPLNIDEFPSGGRDQQLVSHARHSPFVDIDPQATRSLFVGNIPKNISIYELRDMFQRFGNVLDVEIKKMGGNATYGFVLYYDLLHAIHAKQCMDGQNVKGNNIRVGFGKGTPSKTLWIDGLDPHTTDAQLERQIVKYGKVVRLGIDHPRCCAMVQYDNADSAKDALNSLKGSFIGNSKSLMTDFANRDARAAFFSCVGDREVSGPSRSYPGPSGGMIGHRGGMVMPRGGIPVIGIGRAGYTLASPPVDYYFSPYLEESVDIYGRQRPPAHLGRGMRRYGPQVPGEFSRSMDYEEELRAFSRKREWEREREKHIQRPNTSPSGSENEKSEGSDSLAKKNKKDRLVKSGKNKVKDSSPDESNDETNGDSEESCEPAQQKVTKRTRKNRVTNKRMESRPMTNKSCSDNGEASSHVKSKQQRTMLIQKTIASPTHKESGECIEAHKEDECDENLVLPAVTNVKPHVADDINVRVHSNDGTEASEEVARKLGTNKATAIPKEKIDSDAKVQPSTLESPQSPVIIKKCVQRSMVESDFSSDEEFDDSVDLSADIRKSTPVADKECSASGPRTPEPMYQEEHCHKEKQDLPKKLRPLPRQYKLEENVEVQKQGLTEIQERILPLRGVKRYHPASRSPSPPSHRRRRYHSPSSEYVTDKRLCDRGRPSSPDVLMPRRLSRSPPGYCASPTYRRYSTSPHSPRARSPIPQVRGRDRGPSRHLHESPSFDGIRGRYGRRGSPPHRRYPYSPSSPPRHRSPAGRRYGKRRSPSLSSPRQSPGRLARREKSPVFEGCRISPRPSVENTLPTSKRHGKRPKLSRTPSPEQRNPKSGSAISPDNKHRDDHSPKSPALSLHSVPPLPTTKEEEASDKTARNMSKQAVDRESDRLTLGDNVLDNESLNIQCVQSESGPELLSETEPQPLNNLLDLLRRYPVMWQGHLTLKNDLAAVQLHFLSGNAEIAKRSLPPGSNHVTPTLRIAQRMRLEKSQLEGVERRIQNDVEHCLLLALPCGRDPDDVQTQTHTLKNSLISYLLQKQAAGIINVQGPIGSNGYVLHIFPPCPFSQSHLLRVAPDLSRASDNCHLMVIAAAL